MEVSALIASLPGLTEGFGNAAAEHFKSAAATLEVAPGCDRKYK